MIKKIKFIFFIPFILLSTGPSRASVIVERNNQTFVVQQGALLENKYKLLSVNIEYATFEYNGNIFQLSTNLTVDN